MHTTTEADTGRSIIHHAIIILISNVIIVVIGVTRYLRMMNTVSLFLCNNGAYMVMDKKQIRGHSQLTSNSSAPRSC